MDDEGWPQLRDAYVEAWRIRTSTGESTEEVLMEVLRRRGVEARWVEPGGSNDLLVGFWRKGVPPNRLRRAMVKEIPGLLRAMASPMREVYRLFRDTEPVDLSWMEMPDGQRALSDARHEHDLVFRYFHPSVAPVALEFAPDPTGRDVLRHCCDNSPNPDDHEWTRAPVWLRMQGEEPQADVMVGNARVGWSPVPHEAWMSMIEEARAGVVADGTLDVRREPKPDGTVVVGNMRCFLPK